MIFRFWQANAADFLFLSVRLPGFRYVHVSFPRVVIKTVIKMGGCTFQNSNFFTKSTPICKVWRDSSDFFASLNRQETRVDVAK